MTGARTRSLSVTCALVLLAGLAACDPYKGMTQAEIGHKVYQTQCAPCHQADGGGVPDLQPALASSQIVVGDPAILIEVIVDGSRATSLQEREGYGNAMAGYSHLTDQELAAVASYVRASFGNQAAEVGVEEVAALR